MRENEGYVGMNHTKRFLNFQNGLLLCAAMLIVGCTPVSTPPPYHPTNVYNIPPPPTITPSIQFLASTNKEDLSCYRIDASGQISGIIHIPKNQLVTVIGRNVDNSWILIRLEGLSLPNCWIEQSFLDLHGDLNSLPNFSNFIPPPPTVTPFSQTETNNFQPRFQAVIIKENTGCVIERYQGLDVVVSLHQFQIVDVIGRNDIGDMLLVRIEGIRDCWSEATSLDTQGDVSSLPIITFFHPSTPITDTPSPVIDLEVTYKVDVIECTCGGRLGKALVTLTISNGIAPYYINSQEPVYPVLGRFVTFNTVLGVRFILKVTSSDGKRWQDTIIIPNQCSEGCGNTSP